ncbi:MAG: prepilin peptidase [Gemmataceae bacterium]
MLNFAGHLPIIIWIVWTFLVGAAVGSLLNVCIARLPLEKSILWPLGSRCGNCLQAIAWYDNIPLLSYWWLRGRCRRCGSKFSMRYFFVELFTACTFAAIFYLLVIADVHQSAFIHANAWNIRNGAVPWQAWLWVVQHWALAGFLIVAAACDMESREIPLVVTITGTVVGLLFSLALPWPWPEDVKLVPGPVPAWWALMGPVQIPIGAQIWPFWGPLPEGFAADSHLSGLTTGLVGMLTGTFLLRAVRFLATRGLGREALGLGDADMMMMVGAFFGWQVVVVGFFVGALVTLGLAIVQLVVFHDDSLPFGPGLAIGSLATAFAWNRLGPAFQPLLFNGDLLVPVVGAGGLFLFILCWIMGRMRGSSQSPG